MKLALRTKPASAAWNHRFANWLIKARLGLRLFQEEQSDGE